VTARVTDWGLAGLVAALLVTGALTLFAGSPGAVWIIAVHDACGLAIALLVIIKLRRVWPRLVRGALRAQVAGIGASLAVVGCFVAGFLWSQGVVVAPAGYSLLSWHDGLGAILAIAVAVHMMVRAKRLRRRDLAGRRQFLTATGLAGFAVLAWRVQRPVEALLALKGARRRFTGSYEAGSFAGNAFMACTASRYVWMIGSFAVRFAMFRRVGRCSICRQHASHPPAHSPRLATPNTVASLTNCRRDTTARSDMRPPWL
jgi:hypothetical protein